MTNLILSEIFFWIFTVHIEVYVFLKLIDHKSAHAFEGSMQKQAANES
jgi:hypothetical protein